jgi:hypothetical protein
MTVFVAVLALVLAALLAVVCGVLLVLLRGVRRRADELARQMAGLEPVAPLPPDLEAALGAGARRLVVVEVLNPIELALGRNRAAGMVAAVAPERLRKIVVDQVVRELTGQLVSEGVEAEVRVHAAR